MNRREDSEPTATNPVSPPATPVGKPQQMIEDRIHSFMDALMLEIRKHKAWKNSSDEVFKSKKGWKWN